MNDTLQADKKMTREAVLAQRDAMPAEVRATASRVILEKIISLPEYLNARIVLTYIGFGSEIETQAFLGRIVADGKIAVLPRVDRESQSLHLHSAHAMSGLRKSNWGIWEPQRDAPGIAMADVEFVLMPGVAFDRNGNRLGYGRGYYDKLISGASPAQVRVAAAYACQLVDRVPTGASDRKVHRVITETENIATSYDR